MHQAQKKFCEKVKAAWPTHFQGARVLDCGSLDINGTNKYLFEGCTYIGVDLGPGPNVDVVSRIGDLRLPQFDTIISTECFEHDAFWVHSLYNIVFNLLRGDGLFLFTCATEGRPEHGTKRSEPWAAPFTNNYYRNLTKDHIRLVIDCDQAFSSYKFETNTKDCDLYFWGKR